MILELKNIEKSFGEKKVLTGVSFKAEGGKAFGLLGRNGAGKTTSIRILMDVFPANSGEVLIDGQPIDYNSGVYERYAFDSYFTVNMDGVKLSVDYNEELSSDDRLNAYKSYNYGVEIGSLVARILITIIIEMGIALLFGYREKKQLLLLVGVNSGTQIILNVLLNIINYNSGEMVFVVFYVLFELVVFAIEAILFYHLLNKISIKQKPKWLAVVYALVANAVSFGAGMMIAECLPGIF